MRLKADENKENVPGHIGPHPEEYHQIVFSTLTKAVGTKTGAAATRALRAALKELAKECRTRGTLLNDLLTKKGPFAP